MDSDFNLKINGKEYRREDIEASMKVLAEKLKDKDTNNVPDIIDSLSGKGMGGKILANMAKNYLNSATVNVEPLITVLQSKVKEFENTVEESNTTQVSTEVKPAEVVNSPISSTFSKNINVSIKANKSFNSMGDLYKKPNKNTEYKPLKMQNSPFVTVVVYLLIAGVLMGIYYMVKLNFFS